MTWRLFWFILWMAGLIGILYYSLIHALWTLIVAMLVLSIFSTLVLQLEWYR